MNNTDIQAGNDTESDNPFVCQQSPFVCAINPPVMPFVRLSLPFICKRYRGFSIIELIVVLVVAALLATIGIPGMKSIIYENRLITQANNVLADLNFARSEAIRRGSRVTICKSLDPTASSPSCDTATANPWTTGRIIFVDGGTAGTIDGTDTILRITQALDGAGSSGNSMLGDSTAGDPVRISYLGTGLRDTTTIGEIQLRLCDSRGATYGRAIVISNTGRVRIAPRGSAKTGTLSCN